MKGVWPSNLREVISSDLSSGWMPQGEILQFYKIQGVLSVFNHPSEFFICLSGWPKLGDFAMWQLVIWDLFLLIL